MAFSSVEGLLAAARTTPLWQAVLEDDQRDRGVAREHSWAQMERLWKAMQAPLEDYDPARRSPSGLSGGEGARLDGTGPGLCPPFVSGRRGQRGSDPRGNVGPSYRNPKL